MRLFLDYLLHLLAAGVLLLWSASYSHAADPKAMTSEYLRTETGMFDYRGPDRSWRLEVDVSARKAPPGGGPLYLLASFQNPQGGKASTSTAVVTPGAQHPAILVSSPINGMRDGRAYLVAVSVFADKAHTRLLGVHEQRIVYHQVPAEFLRRFK